jgi:hypothetical protein
MTDHISTFRDRAYMNAGGISTFRDRAYMTAGGISTFRKGTKRPPKITL